MSQKPSKTGAMVIFPVVGRAKSWDIAGPVLGVTALPASTPTTPSVEEYDHSTPNLFDNLSIGIGDRMDPYTHSGEYNLHCFSMATFLFTGRFLRRSQGFLPLTRRV